MNLPTERLEQRPASDGKHVSNVCRNSRLCPDLVLDSWEIPCYLASCSLVLCSYLMTAPDASHGAVPKGNYPKRNVSSGSLDTLRCTLYSARLA